MMSEDKNQDYLQKMIDEIKKYEKCLDKFESWFKWVSYDEVKNQDWYKEIESAVINHLAKKNYKIKPGDYGNYSMDIEDEQIYQELKLISNLNESELDRINTYTGDSKEENNQLTSKYELNIDKLRKELFKQIGGIDQTYLDNIFNNTLDNFKGQNRDDTPAKFIYGQTKDVAIKYEGIYYSSR